MNILITFDDGTTEPIPCDTECVRNDLGGFFTDIKPGTPGFLHSVISVRTAQGPTWRSRVWVRRAGDWQTGRLESVTEQIARLTREGDAARAVADAVADAVDTYNRSETESASDVFMALRVHPAVMAWRK